MIIDINEKVTYSGSGRKAMMMMMMSDEYMKCLLTLLDNMIGIFSTYARGCDLEYRINK